MVRAEAVLLWVCVPLFAAVASPGQTPERTAVGPVRTPSPGFSATLTAVSTPVTLQTADDDYAHVFYQFSKAGGFHVFVHTAQGEREITHEPGWETRHRTALAAHHRARRQGYVQAHLELDAAIRDAILAGALMRGMTIDQVLASAGDPAEEHRTLSRRGVIEEWRYGITLAELTGEFPVKESPSSCAEGSVTRKGQACVLRFLDGVLISWQSGRQGGMMRPTPSR